MNEDYARLSYWQAGAKKVRDATRLAEENANS
jgi:hypothetical protein